MPVYDSPDDLSQKKRGQDRNKIEHEDDEDGDTGPVDPMAAEIPLLPVGRFDEPLKAAEHATPGSDFALHLPGLSDRS